MQCAQYLIEPNTLASTPSQAPKEFELTMTPVGIPMSNLTNISVDSTDTSNDAVKPNNSNAVTNAKIDELPQDTSRPLFDLSDDTAPTFPLETSNNHSTEKSQEKSNVPSPPKNCGSNAVPDIIPAAPRLKKNEEIQPPDPPPEETTAPKLSSLIRPKPLQKSPPAKSPEPAKVTLTPPSVDNSIVALKRLENRARRTRIAATTKTSKPPTVRGYRFT